MEKIKIFLDADIIISSLLSKKGASYEILNNNKLHKVVSPSVKKEVIDVTKRLKIYDKDVKEVFKKCNVKPLNLTKRDVLRKYSEYIIDEEDSHVVAGAHVTRSKFLLTYNIRHYQVNRISSGLGVSVLKPGNFLQYLRSLNKF